MKKFGPITTPLEGISVINNYEHIVDFYLDLKTTNMEDAFRMMVKDSKPKLLIVTNKERDVAGVITYMPPPGWRTPKDQVLKLWAGNNLQELYVYFSNWHHRNNNPFERQAILTILVYIEKLLKVNDIYITYSVKE